MSDESLSPHGSHPTLQASSFALFAQTADAVAATTKRLEKLAILG